MTPRITGATDAQMRTLNRIMSEHAGAMIDALAFGVDRRALIVELDDCRYVIDECGGETLHTN